MFTLNHFIWLFISGVIVFTFVYIFKKLNFSFERKFNILTAVVIASETTKILNNIKMVDGGGYLEPSQLPFHLCSIQVILVLAARFLIKNEKTKDILYKFMYPTMVAGGFFALLIPIDGVEFTNIMMYQYFIFHASIVGFGVSMVVNHDIEITYKDIFIVLGIFASLAAIGIYINGILQVYSIPEIKGDNRDINFFFLAKPPMEGLPFLTIKYGWGVYFVHLSFLAVFLITGMMLPFAIINSKKKQK